MGFALIGAFHTEKREEHETLKSWEMACGRGYVSCPGNTLSLIISESEALTGFYTALFL